ncbi:predicted protein [Nematostella vectensis]|uniref:G-protein coupled receptors family 1 profile domain-containing protein n=1 Tax=Nematostella vectensis TaxID=45351 RepID=A7T0H3_NEMVE|nr:predicted protein [Nematostella vectensis]|eukprot:XP_001622636.1 predicted protein [Nematostella vectensis]
MVVRGTFAVHIVIIVAIATVTIVIAWFLSALVTSPSLYTMRVIKMDGVPYCHEIWSPPLHPTVSPLVFTIVSFVALYALPLTIIIALYSTIVYKMWFRKIPGNSHSSIRELEQRVKRNVVKMLITVVGVFTVFWLPLHLNLLLRGATDVFSRCGAPDALSFTAYVLSHATGAVNFAIYVFFSEEYSQGFKEVLALCWMRERVVFTRGSRTEMTLLSRKGWRGTFRDARGNRVMSSPRVSSPRTGRGGLGTRSFIMEYSSNV